jgi:hypothetical protein
MLATIDYHGVPLAVEFGYYAGYAGDRIDPPEPAQAEIATVKAGAVDITAILTDEQAEEIADACVEWVSAQRAAAMEARAERERNEENT